MRYSPVAMALALGFACVTRGVLAQKPDSQTNPLSVSPARAGEAARAATIDPGAIDRLASALAADPRNPRAYIPLGKVTPAQELPSTTHLRYRPALPREPTPPP